jgi:hypothetical protein
MNKKFIFLIIFVLAVAVIYAVVIDIKEEEDVNILEESIIKENSAKEENLIEEVEENNREDDISIGTGYIEGALYGWSEVLPIGLHICAQNIDTEYYYCTDKSFENYKFKYGRGYQLKVPVGSYKVAGILPSSLINPEKLREFKSVSENCNQKDVECLSTLDIIEVFDEKISRADLNSKGKLDLFKTFDLTQYPNYK